MSAIERIQGFACEVTQEQWEELVRVADSVGVVIDKFSRRTGTTGTNAIFKWKYAIVVSGKHEIMTYDKIGDRTLIPYPDFLSKLKGEEKWEPKNGEEVEVEIRGAWRFAEFVAMHKGYFICGIKHEWNYLACSEKQIRKTIETITRQEAEAILNKRIID